MEEFKLNIGNTLNKQSMSDPLEKVMTLKKLLTSKAQDDTYDENSLFDIEYSISTNGKLFNPCFSTLFIMFTLLV